MPDEPTWRRAVFKLIPTRDDVEGVNAVLGGERGDIFLPFQNRAADSCEKNDGGAGASRLPEAGAECTYLHVSVLERIGGGFTGFGDDHTRSSPFCSATA